MTESQNKKMRVVDWLFLATIMLVLLALAAVMARTDASDKAPTMPDMSALKNCAKLGVTNSGTVGCLVGPTTDDRLRFEASLCEPMFTYVCLSPPLVTGQEESDCLLQREKNHWSRYVSCLEKAIRDHLEYHIAR